MPRDCMVCGSQDRQRIEHALANGATFAAISRESRFTMFFPDAIRRHWENHVAPAVRDQRNGGPGLGVVTIASHLVELLHAAQDVRRRTIEQNRDATAVRAIREEREIVLSIADRLGIRGDQSLDELQRLASLSEAVMRAARSDPSIALAIASELDDLDRADDAASLRVIITSQKEIA
jgi:hypothetical protein